MGLITLTRPVSGEKQNSSGNLEILLGIGRLEKSSRTLELKIGTSSTMFPKISGSRIFQIFGTTSFTHSIAQTAFVRVVTLPPPPVRFKIRRCTINVTVIAHRNQF